MNKTQIRQGLNVLAVALTIIMNILANALPLNGQNTGEISDRFKVYFVPAGYVFSIWGLIYIGLIAFAIYQLLWNNARLDRIGYWFIVSCAANILWLFLWHYNLFVLTLLAMLTLLASLIIIYLRLNISRQRAPAIERWMVDAPFSLYLGWITVATIANFTSTLDYLRWNGWGIQPQIWAVILLAAGVAIAVVMSLTRGDVIYQLVLIWAFVGIAVKHAGTPLVAIAAWVAAGLVAVSLAVGLLYGRRLKSKRV